MKTDSIAIGTRIGQLVDPAFFVSWTELLRGGLRPDDVVLMPAVGMPHSGAANTLIERFLHTTCDALLFVDDDMVFNAATLNALRSTVSGHAILSALYTTRREPIRPIVLDRFPDGFKPRRPEECHGIVDCDVVGLGFTLISRELIEYVARLRGETEGVFTWSNTLGEDGEFCQTAIDAGYQVGVNCDVIVGHRVTYTSTWNVTENAVEMCLESFGMNIKRKEEKT